MMSGTNGPLALYSTFLGNVATRGRLAGLTALSLVPIAVALGIRLNDASDPLDDGVSLLVADIGLALIVPVITLVLASATLGDPNEDGTLVYLWLRPTPRWQLAVAATAAALTVALPVGVVPLAVAAAVTGAGSDLVVATVVSCVVAVAGYGGLFTWLGLRMKRAMAWGLAYVLVWEGFVARAGDGTEALSIRSHTVSVLSRLADGPERLWESTLANGIVIPLVAGAVAVWFTGRRLQRQDVA